MMTTHRIRFNLLEGMRGVAALYVVVLHALDAFGLDRAVVPHAPLAVDFFFVLSGFIVAHAYEQALLNGLTFGQFAKQRAIRLYPMVLIGCVLGFVALAAGYVLTGKWAARSIDALLTLVFNALLLPAPWLAPYEHNTGWAINLPLWSLTFEVAVNLVYGAWLYRLKGRAHVHVLLGATVAWLATRLWVAELGGPPDWHGALWGMAYVMLPFYLGVWVWRQRLWWHPQRPKRGAWLWATAVLSLAFCLPGIQASADAWYRFLWVAAGFPILVAWCARAEQAGDTPTWMRWLGDISYPLYLTHYPVIKTGSFMLRRSGLDLSLPVIMLGVLVELGCCLVLAWFVSQHIEKPMRAWASKRLMS